jgi:hypothetical protein
MLYFKGYQSTVTLVYLDLKLSFEVNFMFFSG